MKFIIEKEIFEQFPQVQIGLFTAHGIDNSTINKVPFELIRMREREIKEEFDLETLTKEPRISSWRQAYSLFGAKPKKYNCSVENLYRMILTGVHLESINPIVDIYNYISLKYITPVGGDDLDKIVGDIRLKISNGTELFKKLNTNEIQLPKTGEVVYIDDEEVLCRRWNWRESDKSKMTPQTKNVALVVEGLPPVTREEVLSILDELELLVQKHVGGETRKEVLNGGNPEADLVIPSHE